MLYFRASDGSNGSNGFELWRINAVTGQAEMVEDAVAGGGINPGSDSSDSFALTNANGTLYLSANDGSNGRELWRVEKVNSEGDLSISGTATDQRHGHGRSDAHGRCERYRWRNGHDRLPVAARSGGRLRRHHWSDQQHLHAG